MFEYNARSVLIGSIDNRYFFLVFFRHKLVVPAPKVFNISLKWYFFYVVPRRKLVRTISSPKSSTADHLFRHCLQVRCPAFKNWDYITFSLWCVHYIYPAKRKSREMRLRCCKNNDQVLLFYSPKGRHGDNCEILIKRKKKLNFHWQI